MRVKAKVVRPEGSRWERMRSWQWYRPVKSGISFGSALAMVLSYTQNKSILWAIIHGILSWVYVIYRIILQISWF
ncbi:hypothetical protein JW707_01575 [Candidatus Woesearchaeota archaeon]|nr:hypothetical protein [Candidatus Woesearchaeota archaeon]